MVGRQPASLRGASGYVFFMEAQIGATESEALAYRRGLNSRQLASALERLGTVRRRCDWLTCRYLADLADRLRVTSHYRSWEVADITELSETLHLGERGVRERARIGRALRLLPQIENAFKDDELTFSQTRELCRVATPGDQGAWLEFARQVGLRELERRVAQARAAGRLGVAGDSDEHDPKPSQPNDDLRERRLDDGSVDVTLRLSAEAANLLHCALAQVREAAAVRLSDANALEALLRAATAGTPPEEVGRAEFRRKTPSQEPAATNDPQGSPDPTDPDIRSSRDPRGSRTTSRRSGGPARHQGSAHHNGTANPAPPLRRDAIRVYAAMGERLDWDLDVLAERSGVASIRVRFALAELERAGYVEQQPFNYSPILWAPPLPIRPTRRRTRLRPTAEAEQFYMRLVELGCSRDAG